MDSQTIRTALGLLQENPEDEGGWQSLEEALGSSGGDLSRDEVLKLLDAARQLHRQRGEWEAVASLIELALPLAADTGKAPKLLSELGAVQSAQLLDEEQAGKTWQRLMEIDHELAAAALEAYEESQEKRAKWRDLVGTYANEAEEAPDEVYRSSMLMRAAETALRYGGGEADRSAAIDRLEQAVRLDTNNGRAVQILERIYRMEEKWEDAARVLERYADQAEDPPARIATGIRLARLYADRLDDKERAIRAYQRVLKDAPGSAEAMSYLSDLFSKEERWEELVKLYERRLEHSASPSSERLGEMLQIAMLYWKKLERLSDAEVWFDQVRKLEPAHPGMLVFYREYLGSLGDEARLLGVLQAAQRASSNDEEKARLATELARLSESQLSAQKAIEQYKSVLRHDADNVEAREALKRLYKQTEGYNALVELLRQQLERTDPAQYEARLAILREVADVYRTFIKSDTALVSVLNQIVHLDEKVDEEDVAELRELVGLYEKLGRWRDLLTHQLKLAELTPDLEEKKALYRAAGERWLDQFTNVQNATEAFEHLLKLAPEDADARQKLEQLYRKRRAWPALYDLFAGELESAEGAARVAIMKEMAQLAAERLNRGPDAVNLYRRILDEDPSRLEVLDALEKHAERARDWVTLAEALERRAALQTDEKERLAVLQKLGVVYADHLHDPKHATLAWRRVLQIQPGHHRALRVLRDSYLLSGDYDGLEELYASQNDYEGLAEVLSNAADRNKNPEVKIALSYRAAAVYVDRLGQPDRAFRSYERVLTAKPTDERAARALIPLYEADEKWARLPPLYEVLLAQSDSAGEKLDLLQKLVSVSGLRLSDRKAAVAYARKAYELAPTNEATLSLLEETSRVAGNWDGFVQAIEGRLQSPSAAPRPAGAGRRRGRAATESEEEAEPGEGLASELSPSENEVRSLELKLAEICAGELSQTEKAISIYKRLLERNPADQEAATALEAILRREDKRDELRWLLDLRVANTWNEDEKVRILGDWAMLEEDVFESSEHAVALYRRVLDLDSENDAALRALPRLLLAAGDAESAAAVIEQDRDRLSGNERAEREVELAELYLERLPRPEDALDAAVRALELRPDEKRAIEVLERLQKSQAQARAAAVLAEHYAATGEARLEARSLEILLPHSKGSHERLALYKRLADVHEHRLESWGAALEVMLRAVREYPAEVALWDRADALAAEAERPTDLAEAFRDVMRQELLPEVQSELSDRAARLHQEKLGDPMGATPYLEKVLELEPTNESAFERLKDILTAAERWSELEAMYDRAARATDDPARRAEMLVEVALISEEIVEDPAKATKYYERILAIDPLHEASMSALDRLYAQQKRHPELAALLEKRLETAVGDEIIELKLRLARIQLEHLLEPARAVAHVEYVLEERPNDYTARELAEKILEIGTLRDRAARMLEHVYEQRDEIRDLVRVLAIQLEELNAAIERTGSIETSQQAENRRSLLRRIATLRDDRLHDDDGALEVLAELVPLDPLDEEARERLLDIGRRVGAHERVAEVMSRAAERADTPSAQGEILSKVAAICEDMLGDVPRAERTHRTVLELDPHDATLVLPAARALERIYASSGRNEQLAEMLRIQVRFEQDREVRTDLLGRLGELCQTVLGDSEGAIRAWKARAEENPEDDTALGALDQLYQRTERWRDLVEVLEKRRDIAVGDEDRRSLTKRLATVLATKLDSVAEAIDAWRSVLDEFGPDEASLSALEGLFEAAERWEELADTLERHLEIVSNDQDRLGLLARLGNLRREHLSDLSGSLDAYRNALTVDPGHAPSRAALESLLTVADPIARRDAAEVLHPIYEGDGDHKRLLKVLEIEIETSDDPGAKLQGLEKAIEVADVSLDDQARAFEYAQKALRVAVGFTELDPWLNHVERLARVTGKQPEFVRLLCEVIPDIFDASVQVEVALKVADLARHQLADRELAKRYYNKALELRADDAKALEALESLYEEAGDAQNLLSVLERRSESAGEGETRKQLFFRRARLLAEVLDDKARAIEVYEAILDMSLDPAALSALEVLYAEEQRWGDLVSLYERQLDARAGDPAALHVKIATTCAQRQQDVDRAFDELERALEIERQHGGAIAELERLLVDGPEAAHRARAAELLEPVYLLRADYTKVMRTLRARLDFSEDPAERRELLGRLAKLYEEQTEDYVAALETTALLLHEDLADENTIAELERLGKVAGAERKLAEVYAKELEQAAVGDEATARIAKRAGELFTDLGELDRALGFLRRALAFTPESEELFAMIDAILERTKQHEARVDLYREGLEHRFEPAARLRMLHTIAQLQRRELSLPDAAIDTYRMALDVDEADRGALDALTELYRERERWEDLSELYLRRADAAPTQQEGAGYRLALAKLLRDEIGDTERAIDQLEEIVRAVPDDTMAVRELEQLRADNQHKERVVEILRPLYEARGDWRHTIKLNEDRYALASETADKVGVLRETAGLWEHQGGDPERARRAMRMAFELDPDDHEVRAELERLTELADRWADLAATYDRVLEERPELTSRRDILGVLASICDQRLDDPRRALAAYERLHEEDPSDLEALEKVEQLAMLLSDWQIVVRALVAKAEIVLDDEQRASLWRRVGEAKRDMLQDQAGAIEAYEQALDLEPDSAFTVDCLLELHENHGDQQRLVELYQRRVELADSDDEDLKFELLTAAAKTYEEKLGDRLKAVDVLNQALGVRPGAAEVLAALNRLYRSEEMWPELLENLRLEAGATESRDQRAKLRQEIGSILADKLHSHEEALEAYRLVLDEIPSDRETIAAVRKIAREHDHLRESVASILVPVLEGQERYEELVEVLEMRLTVESDSVQRADTLRTVSSVLETKLGRNGDALVALLRAIAERPDEPELHAESERLAAVSSGWPQYADALADRAQATFEPDVARDLYTRLGRIAEERLQDDQRAIAAYAKAVDQAGDEPGLLEALDRLYTKTSHSEALSGILERRIVLEAAPADQAELNYRLAVLQIREFEELGRGLASLRQALEAKPEHEAATRELERLTDNRDLFEEAAEVLEEVYRSQAQTAPLARLYEKRVEFAETNGERIEKRRDLARVLEEDCGKADEAQRVLQAALLDDPSDAALLDEIERLAGSTGEWKAAAEALTAAIEKSLDLPSETARELHVRVASWQRDRVGDKESAEKALVAALALEPGNDETLQLIEQLQRDPGRERDLVATLRRRAKLVLGDDEREGFYRQCRELADSLGDSALAEGILRELLGQDESNLWALAELTELREAAGDYQETLDLLVRRSELRATSDIVNDLRHKAAAIARDRLQQPGRAIALYEALFEDDPADAQASAALRVLYQEQHRVDEMVRLLERLVDLADAPAERNSLRMELAQLNAKEYRAYDTAIDLLRAVLDDEPGHPEAVVALSQLLEATDRDEELADLLSEQINGARERGSIEAELKFQVRLGEVYETRLNDRARAIETYRRVLDRDPDHRGALEALARLYQAGQNHAEAAEILDHLLGISTGDEAVRLSGTLADVQAKLGNTEQAAAALERGLHADPRHSALRARLRSMYSTQGAWDKLANIIAQDAEFAKEEHDKVRLFREAADIHSGRRGDPAQAAELLERASEIKPDDRGLLLQLCDCYSACGRGKAAAEVLERVVESYGGKRSKELGEIHRRLADAYLAEGDQERALGELDKAFRIEPGNANVLKDLGIVALQVGDLKKAQQMFRALLLQRLDEKAPITKAEVFLHLGDVHLKLDEKAKAKQMFERALQQDANLAAARERLEELNG